MHGREEGCADSRAPLNDVGLNESRQIDGRLLSENFSDLRPSSRADVCLCVGRVLGAGMLLSLPWFRMKKALADATFPRTGAHAAPTLSQVAGCMTEVSASLTFRVDVMIEALLEERESCNLGPS